MKRNRRIIAMLLLLFFSSILMKSAELKYHQIEKEQCLADLKDYTDRMSDEIRRSYQSDREYLERVADILADGDLSDDEMSEKSLELLGGSGMLAEVQLLLPGGRLMTEQGQQNVSGRISFEDEAQKGSCVSKRMEDPFYPDRMIVRMQIPVVKDGETAALLWGIMDLADFSKIFAVSSYQEGIYLYVAEGATGNFLLDTWHNELYSMDELKKKSAKCGFGKGPLRDDFAAGKEGTAVFFFEEASENFYASYAPAGVEDWMVMITVAENVVFAHAEEVHQAQMLIMQAMLLVFLIYGGWLLHDVKREKNEHERQLRRVRYLLDVEKQLFSAFIEPSHFADGLQVIADYAGAEYAFFWGDARKQEDSRIWTNDNQSQSLKTDFRGSFPEMVSILKEKGSLLVYNWDALQKSAPGEAGKLLAHGVRNMMLIRIRRLNGEDAGVLGVCNMKRRWENAELLEQVSLTLSMTWDHYKNYQDLIRMGKVDALTGLWNRNSYHEALARMEKEACGSVACVYLDANGLHEINNQLGHQAGDVMLKTVADVLREYFPEDGVFRIGGDEFVVLCGGLTREEVQRLSEAARGRIREKEYEVSLGVGWQESGGKLTGIIDEAEAAMQRDKERYYKENGRERQERVLNRAQERLALQKQAMDRFLELLAPRFKGVYFVDLQEDSVRHIFIPDYFEEMLEKAKDSFSRALLLYARETVDREYMPLFEQLCDYGQLKQRLNSGERVEFMYRKKDGVWMKLQILQLQGSGEKETQTLWMFTELSQKLQTEEKRN